VGRVTYQTTLECSLKRIPCVIFDLALTVFELSARKGYC